MIFPTGPLQAGDRSPGQKIRLVRGSQLNAPGVAEDEARDRSRGSHLLLPENARRRSGWQRQQHRGPAPEGEPYRKDTEAGGRTVQNLLWG